MKNSILVTSPLLPSYDDYCNEIKDIWENHYLTNEGPKHKKLEQELKNYLKANHVSLLTNGHLALQLGIKALQMKGEVITTPFTFVSTINAIIENGLTPVFCDIDPKTYTIDVKKIESLITPKTCAILGVHVYGNICDVEAIHTIAKKYHLKVIYDAAHAMGEKYKGKAVANYGDLSMMSFHATKVFNTIEGGALVYQEASLYEKIKALKNFGIDSNGEIVEESINAKMNEFQAAMGLCNLRILQDSLKKRQEVAEYYDKCLSCQQGLKLNIHQPDVVNNYAYYPVLFQDEGTRDLVFNELQKNKIFSRKYFFPLITEFSYYRKFYDSKDTPIALDICSRVLCLPMYASLSLQDVEYISKTVIEIVRW